MIGDLLYVATHLNVDTSVIPPEFTIEYDQVKPEEVFSPEKVFGPLSGYEFRDYFSRFYDQVLKVWTDGDEGVVPAEVKAAVLIQQNSYDDYLLEIGQWTLGYNSNRLLEYRKYLAQILISICP